MDNIWTTKEGKEVKIKNMTTSHIMNTINMLENWAKRKRAEVVSSYLLTPPPHDPDSMASYQWENEFDSAMNSTDRDYLPKIYFKMKEELEKRLEIKEE